MKKKCFKEKTKDFLTSTGNILLILVGIALFAVITALIGKSVNYSPWSLLIIDIIFIFAVYKFSYIFYHNDHSETNRKKKRFWIASILVIFLLGVAISIAVSLKHSWAMLNIGVLIFLFFFCLVLVISSIVKKRQKQNLI